MRGCPRTHAHARTRVGFPGEDRFGLGYEDPPHPPKESLTHSLSPLSHGLHADWPERLPWLQMSRRRKYGVTGQSLRLLRLKYDRVLRRLGSLAGVEPSTVCEAYEPPLAHLDHQHGEGRVFVTEGGAFRVLDAVMAELVLHRVGNDRTKWRIGDIDGVKSRAAQAARGSRGRCLRGKAT